MAKEHFNGNYDINLKSKVYNELKKQQFDLIQILQWGALFGGSVGVMMFDNITDEEMAKPIDKEKIKKSKYLRLYVTDRWYGVSVIGTDTVDDMSSLDFGKPKMYKITFANGKILNVHHDYILRYEHCAYAFLHKAARFNDHRMENSVQSKADNIFYLYAKRCR